MKKFFDRLYFKMNEREIEALAQNISVLYRFVEGSKFVIEDNIDDAFYDSVIALYNVFLPHYQEGYISKLTLKEIRKNVLILNEKIGMFF